MLTMKEVFAWLAEANSKPEKERKKMYAELRKIAEADRIMEMVRTGHDPALDFADDPAPDTPAGTEPSGGPSR